MNSDTYASREAFAHQQGTAVARSAGVRLRALAASGVVIFMCAACASRSPRDNRAGAPPAAATMPASHAVVQVSMRDVQFSPESVEIKPGDTVEWRNDDLVPHTATSVSFDSGSLDSGQTWRHTFPDAGTFSYDCSFHPQMKGVVVVK